MEFVARRQDWIEEKSSNMVKRRLLQPHLGIKEGDCLYFLGECYPVYTSDKRSGAFDGKCFMLPRTPDAGELLTVWYRKQADKLIRPRVELYAARMQARPAGVRITSAKTRWGSCSYVNHINFSWRLVMCPPDVIDYVVVHELCHIRHKDHSSRFWEAVAQYDAEYKAHRRWLREHSILMEDNW